MITSLKHPWVYIAVKFNLIALYSWTIYIYIYTHIDIEQQTIRIVITSGPYIIKLYEHTSVSTDIYPYIFFFV